MAIFIASQIESCNDPLLEAKLIAALTIYAEAGPGPGMTRVRGAGAAGEGAAAAPKTGPAKAAEFAGSEEEAVLLEELARREVTHPPGTVMGMGRGPHKFAGQKVADIMKGKKGSIQQAPLEEGSPAWRDILGKTWEEIEAGAKAGEKGYDTIKKLLTDKRFDR